MANDGKSSKGGNSKEEGLPMMVSEEARRPKPRLRPAHRQDSSSATFERLNHEQQFAASGICSGQREPSCSSAGAAICTAASQEGLSAIVSQFTRCAARGAARKSRPAGRGTGTPTHRRVACRNMWKRTAAFG